MVQSCNNEIKKNENLIYFKAKFITEIGNDDYEKYLNDIQQKINIQYFNEIIFVQKITEVNSCGEYLENIDIINDTIFLRYDLISKEVCTSTMFEKLSYMINNPSNKKYHFTFKE